MQSIPTVGAIILAAGKSQRMGAHKVLLPFAGSTVIQHLVGTLTPMPLAGILVVVGHRAKDVQKALASTAAETVPNPQYAQGMLSSVRAGLRAAPKEWKGAMIFLGDQPQVDPEVVGTLLQVFTKNPNAIAVPTFKGRRGHPLLFSMEYREEILNGYDNEGLRGLMSAYPNHLVETPVEAQGVLFDMDTPEDYKKALRQK